MGHSRSISVVGLGYVGLPVAVAFGQSQSVIGFDISTKRIDQLKDGIDETHEVTKEDLLKANITYTSDSSQLASADFHIIAVPTPVDDNKKPDMSYLESASKLVGEQLKKGDIVVFESTVFPGATEEICLPILESTSKLVYGEDFTIGYSPERINPGDLEHRFTNITKVVSGSDEATLEIVANVYESVVEAGVHRAQSIKVAEAAKVIENTQRDLNIALMNELALIFHKMNIDTEAVLEAAGTKWNFLPFRPGLVGGHCIGVDPYYLTEKAKQVGYEPEVILAGRRINDSMGLFIAQETIKTMIANDVHIKGAKVAVLGLTFKENCPDMRNSKVKDVVNELKDYGIEVILHDPIACPMEVQGIYHQPLTSWEQIDNVDAVIVCVAHEQYLEFEPSVLVDKTNPNHDPIIIDVKSKLDAHHLRRKPCTKLWRL